MTSDVKPPLPTSTRENARVMRRAPTDAERKLWSRLRAGRLRGFKFRRQHPLPPYIADFYCESLKLVVELDGSQHGMEFDALRSSCLQARGLTILRFWSHDALLRTDAVLQAVLDFAEGRTLTPTPLPAGEGP